MCGQLERKVLYVDNYRGKYYVWTTREESIMCGQLEMKVLCVDN